MTLSIWYSQPNQVKIKFGNTEKITQRKQCIEYDTNNKMHRIQYINSKHRLQCIEYNELWCIEYNAYKYIETKEYHIALTKQTKQE